MRATFTFTCTEREVAEDEIRKYLISFCVSGLEIKGLPTEGKRHQAIPGCLLYSNTDTITFITYKDDFISVTVIGEWGKNIKEAWKKRIRSIPLQAKKVNEKKELAKKEKSNESRKRVLDSKETNKKMRRQGVTVNGVGAYLSRAKSIQRDEDIAMQKNKFRDKRIDYSKRK